MPGEQPIHRTSALVLIVAWLVVAIPAAWGVSQTFVKSLDLFRSPTTTQQAR
jgi:hypothetical protein